MSVKQRSSLSDMSLLIPIRFEDSDVERLRQRVVREMDDLKVRVATLEQKVNDAEIFSPDR